MMTLQVVVFFLQGNYMCLYMKLETRLPIGFPDIIDQQVRKLSILEIRQNRGHKPLLIQGSLMAFPTPPRRKWLVRQGLSY